MDPACYLIYLPDMQSRIQTGSRQSGNPAATLGFPGGRTALSGTTASNTRISRMSAIDVSSTTSRVATPLADRMRKIALTVVFLPTSVRYRARGASRSRSPAAAQRSSVRPGSCCQVPPEVGPQAVRVPLPAARNANVYASFTKGTTSACKTPDNPLNLLVFPSCQILTPCAASSCRNQADSNSRARMPLYHLTTIIL